MSLTVYPCRLSGAKVILREFCPTDLDRVMSVVGDDRVTSSLSFDTRTREQAIAMLDGTLHRAKQEPRTEYYLAVTIADDVLVGFARLGLDGVQAAKLGYAIAADYWGYGYATDAARTLVDFGFRGLRLHRISAAMGPDNTASIAIAHRLGMTYEGRIRDHVHTNGQWRDSLLYSVLFDEWVIAETSQVPSTGKAGSVNYRAD